VDSNARNCCIFPDFFGIPETGGHRVTEIEGTRERR